jgi:hypothetical protein
MEAQPLQALEELYPILTFGRQVKPVQQFQIFQLAHTVAPLQMPMGVNPHQQLS